MVECTSLIVAAALAACGGGLGPTGVADESLGTMGRVAKTPGAGLDTAAETLPSPAGHAGPPAAQMPLAPLGPLAPLAPAAPEATPIPVTDSTPPAAINVAVATPPPATPPPATPAPATPPVPASTTAPAAPVGPAALTPVIYRTLIPAATQLADSSYGQPLRFNAPRIRAANQANPSQVANASDIGAFREPCNFSHMSFDDPIAYPGQPGRSHLHAFFGNTDTGAATTAATLANSGDSTCAGGTLNRSSYWVPAMIDTRTGAPVKPSSSIFYYKTGYNGIRASSVQPLPQGLRMIAGSASNSVPSGPFRYGCVGGADTGWYGQSIPTCAVGDDMLMEVAFPQCWDGVNLDSPNHISHMADPVGGSCPSSHPVPVPLISFEIHYTIKASDMPSKWRLSSDNYASNLPGGYSGHGDWFSGWDPAVMNTMIANCEQRSLDCHAYLLGDGRMLY